MKVQGKKRGAPNRNASDPVAPGGPQAVKAKQTKACAGGLCLVCNCPAEVCSTPDGPYDACRRHLKFHQQKVFGLSFHAFANACSDPATRQEVDCAVVRAEKDEPLPKQHDMATVQNGRNKELYMKFSCLTDSDVLRTTGHEAKPQLMAGVPKISWPNVFGTAEC